MAVKTLAVKYRPDNWEDVVEQNEIKIILQQQLQTNTFKNAYLFVGPAGCGKTTCARIFANEINEHKGNPIEMDAASNSGVDDVREIIQQAKTKSLDSEYKVFIIDECHSISNTGWQAFLKLIEEPPAKSIFIFCTTNPEKIPKTILSRVQRYQFKKISEKAIIDRLQYILDDEHLASYHIDSIEYIAKISDGGMRDAISLMDKCLSYSDELTVENVVKALGTINYDDMMKLTGCIVNRHIKQVIEIIEALHSEGKDLKQFIKSYQYFLLDVQKYALGCDFNLLQIPKTEEMQTWLNNRTDEDFDYMLTVLDSVVKLSTQIKYSNYPKADIEAELLLMMEVNK